MPVPVCDGKEGPGHLKRFFTFLVVDAQGSCKLIVFHFSTLLLLSCCGSAERERKSFHAESRNSIDLSISDRLRLPDQLIHPRLSDVSFALIVYVNSVGGAQRMPINEGAKSHSFSLRCWPHNQMKIAGVKAMHSLLESWRPRWDLNPCYRRPSRSPLFFCR
jgi:hypothetical protein